VVLAVAEGDLGAEEPLVAGELKMKRKLKFSDEQLKKIEASVRDAEKNTSGEIVPMIVFASNDYWWTHWVWGFIGLGIVSLILCAFSLESPWRFHVFEFLLWQLTGFASGFFLALFPPLKRFLIPKSWASYHVERQSMANFMGAGLNNTAGRTGILIYLSQLERQVVILADKGINEKVPNDHWKTLVAEIVEGVHVGKPLDALMAVISKAGTKLSQDFPKQRDDKNELSNELRTRHEDRD